jgi:hypothetical protein
MARAQEFQASLSNIKKTMGWGVRVEETPKQEGEF